MGNELDELKDPRSNQVFWNFGGIVLLPKQWLTLVSRNNHHYNKLCWHSQHLLSIYYAWGAVLHMDAPMQSSQLPSKKKAFSLPTLQMKNLRPIERCQTVIGSLSDHLTDRDSAPTAHNFNGAIPPPSFAKYPSCLYIVNFHLMYCFAGVPMNWVCTHWFIDQTGNYQGQALYPDEFRCVIFSFLCTLPQYLEIMSPQCRATQSRLPLWHLSQTSQELRCAQGSLQMRVMSSVDGGGARRQMLDLQLSASSASLAYPLGHSRPASRVSRGLGSDQVSSPQPATWDHQVHSVQGRHILHSLDCKVFRTWQIANPQVSFQTSCFSQHRTKYLTHNH